MYKDTGMEGLFVGLLCILPQCSTAAGMMAATPLDFEEGGLEGGVVQLITVHESGKMRLWKSREDIRLCYDHRFFDSTLRFLYCRWQ